MTLDPYVGVEDSVETPDAIPYPVASIECRRPDIGQPGLTFLLTLRASSALPSQTLGICAPHPRKHQSNEDETYAEEQSATGNSCHPRIYQDTTDYHHRELIDVLHLPKDRWPRKVNENSHADCQGKSCPDRNQNQVKSRDKPGHFRSVGTHQSLGLPSPEHQKHTANKNRKDRNRQFFPDWRTRRRSVLLERHVVELVEVETPKQRQ